jgi:hypothetical protein
MGNEVKNILMGAIPIAIGFVVASVIYKKIVDRSASATTSGTTGAMSMTVPSK